MTSFAIRARYVLTEKDLAREKSVVVEDGRVKALVPWGEEGVEEILERKEHIVLPGFVDCHTHTQQILLRASIGDELLQLPPIWTGYLIPFERRLDDDLALLSSRLSIANMVRSGTTFFVEAGAPRPMALIEAMKESGMAGAVTLSTFDILDAETPSAGELIERTERLMREARDTVEVWGSLREIMMQSETLMLGIADLCRRRGTGITYHLGEYQGEVDYSLSKYRKRPLEVMEDLGITDIRPTVIAHGVYFSREEIGILRSKQLGLCWCPTVDSILMGPHWAPLVEGVRLGIGSDGGAFTTLDLLHEVKVARAVGKALAVSLRYEKTALGTSDLIKALTGDFGRIVGHNNSLLPGSEANMTVVSLEPQWLYPAHDPAEAVISFAGARDVVDTVVAGRILMRGRKMETIDEGKLTEDLEKNREKIKGIVEELKSSL